MAFLGSVFPDKIDLSPQIFNNYLGFSFPEYENIFPWHKHEFSGSIYFENCKESKIYQILTIVSVYVVCYIQRRKINKIMIRF